LALDHYVSQVHLRNFYSSELGGKKMFAIRKRDLKQFICGSEDVCRLPDGNTNDYLVEPRAVEEFLRYVEPYYNSSVAKLRAETVDPDAIFVIAGFISYVMSCAPAAMRLHSGPLQRMVEAEAAIYDQAGLFPPAPPELGGKTLSELLADGTVQVQIDGKYPQAMGVASVLDRVRLFGNSDWDIVINNHVGSPFFTSDFPTAIEQSSAPDIVNRVVPLAPDLAVRILPTRDEKRRQGDMTFPHFRYRFVKATKAEVRAINELVVRCAEEHVFSPHQAEWVLPFVQKNASYRAETVRDRIPSGDGYFLLSTMRAVRFTD
jgi:hypothetical protein